MLELLSQQARATSLYPLHELVHSELGINFSENMDMIGHDFIFHDFYIQLRSGLRNDLSEPGFDGANQYLSAIFGTKDNIRTYANQGETETMCE